LATSHHNQAGLLAGLGQRDAARIQYETARDLQQKLAFAFLAVPRYQDELASIHNNLGNLLGGINGQRDAARTESAFGVQPISAGDWGWCRERYLTKRWVDAPTLKPFKQPSAN